MAIRIAKQPEVAMLEFACDWFERLGKGDVPGAFAMFDVPSSYGVSWTGSELSRALAEYGSLTLSAITPPSTLRSAPHTSFGEFDHQAGFWFDCSVPLNGRWSDLTAQFEFLSRGDLYEVALQDVHVL